MMVPAWVFDTALWLAAAVVAVDAIYLLTMLVIEWRRGELW